MGRLELPIIIAESRDIIFYDRVCDAELHLEAIDVRNQEYVGYDAKGRLLTFSIEHRHDRTFFGLIPVEFDAVVIQPAEEAPNHQRELRELLAKAVVSLGHEEEAQRMQHLPLPEVVEVARKIIGT